MGNRILAATPSEPPAKRARLWLPPKMTTNNYWQHTMLLQCNLQGVRYEFLQLCVELVRCYAPVERHLYYMEHPDIGEHEYLAAVRQREKRERHQQGLRPEGGTARRAPVNDEVCQIGHGHPAMTLACNHS